MHPSLHRCPGHSLPGRKERGRLRPLPWLPRWANQMGKRGWARAMDRAPCHSKSCCDGNQVVSQVPRRSQTPACQHCKAEELHSRSPIPRLQRGPRGSVPRGLSGGDAELFGYQFQLRSIPHCPVCTSCNIFAVSDMQNLTSGENRVIRGLL